MVIVVFLFVMVSFIIMVIRALILGPHEACTFTVILGGVCGVNSVCAHIVADHFGISVATMVVSLMSTRAEDVEFNTCWESETIVAFFLNMEADERNSFFVLVTHHFHDFAKFLHTDVAVLICIIHCEHHFGHVVVIVVFAVRSLICMVVAIMIVFFRHHHFRHFCELTKGKVVIFVLIKDFEVDFSNIFTTDW